MNLIQLAMEEVAQGVKKEKEQEVVFYCKLGNPQGLAQAFDHEWQEQAQIKAPSGRIRIRKTVKDGAQPMFELTTKHMVNHHGVIEMDETTVPIIEEVYDRFMSVCDEKWNKTRYRFKMERIYVSGEHGENMVEAKDMFYEVDVFTKQDGTTSQWVKIDVEIQNLIPQLKAAGFKDSDVKLKIRLSKLPIEPKDIVFDNRDGDRDRAALINELYQHEFPIKLATGDKPTV